MARIEPPENENKYPEPQMFGPMPASGFFMRHMRNVEMSHVEIANTTPDARSRVLSDRCGAGGLLCCHGSARNGWSLRIARREGSAHWLEQWRRRIQRWPASTTKCCKRIEGHTATAWPSVSPRITAPQLRKFHKPIASTELSDFYLCAWTATGLRLRSADPRLQRCGLCSSA